MGDKKEARPRVMLAVSCKDADRRKGMLAEATKKPKSPNKNQMKLKKQKKTLKDMTEYRLSS